MYLDHRHGRKVAANDLPIDAAQVPENAEIFRLVGNEPGQLDDMGRLRVSLRQDRHDILQYDPELSGHIRGDVIEAVGHPAKLARNADLSGHIDGLSGRRDAMNIAFQLRPLRRMQDFHEFSFDVRWACHIGLDIARFPPHNQAGTVSPGLGFVPVTEGVSELAVISGKRTRIGALATALAVSFLVAACGEEQKAPPQVIRAVKTIVVQPQDAVSIRRVSGLVRAVNRAPLAFEVAGTVAKVMVKSGDRVKKGQVLASLDPRQYQLNLQSAEAELRRAKAELADKESTFRAKETLYKKKVESKTAFDRAKADYDGAQEKVKKEQSKVSLAQRDLAKTTLRAPYDGLIAKREVDPSQVVASGKVVFEVQGGEDLEVSVSVPDGMVKFLKRGQGTDVVFPTLPKLKAKGRIDEVSSQGGEANTFPVTVRLIDPSPDLRSGMSAEVIFQLPVPGFKKAFAVPVSALVPVKSKGRNPFVYVFDKATSTLRIRKVTVAAVRGNDVLIGTGLKKGDIVVVAGVAFLHDGMKVKLMAGAKASKG